MTTPAPAPAAPAPAPPTPPAPPAPTPPAPVPPAPPAYEAPATQQDLDRVIGQRLMQERAKFGGLTGDEVAAMKADHDRLKAASGTDAERAAADAVKAANDAADAKYRPQLAETAFRVAIGDGKPAAEVDEFIADLNLSRFITDDGKVDTAKVLARVKEFVPVGAPPKTPPPKGPVVPGHNPGGTQPASPGSQSGREMYQNERQKTRQPDASASR